VEQHDQDHHGTGRMKKGRATAKQMNRLKMTIRLLRQQVAKQQQAGDAVTVPSPRGNMVLLDHVRRRAEGHHDP
jgi:hypothetical protein